MNQKQPTDRNKCAAECGVATDHVSGYCSDECLQSVQDFDSPPVTILARNKVGGFGHSLGWANAVAVDVPRLAP